MEQAEVRELLKKMNALVETDEGECIDSAALMEDPIVSNRLAVELLQKLDRDLKPELVLAPAGVESYFGYSVALSAWMRFGLLEVAGDECASTTVVKKKEKVVLVLDTLVDDVALNAIKYVEEREGKVVAILSLLGCSSTALSGYSCHSLL